MTFLITLLTIFRVAFVGDPQVDNTQELDYARRSVYSELRQRTDLGLVVVLGDLVNDKPGLIAPSKACLDSMSTPWLCTPGNHDKDVYGKRSGKPRDTATFRKSLGYVDTAFVCGGVNFILMDNVRTKGTADYEGGLREAQKQWLRETLCRCGKAPIVLCGHIPFSEFKSKDSLQAILAPYTARMLMMCGHTHNVWRGDSGYGCEEVQAGATCGSWWRGQKDAQGVPYALMNCGAPRGYFVAEFRPKARQWYRLSYKCVGRSSNEQLSAAVLDSTLYINVYGGSTMGSVSVKGGKNKKWTALKVSEAMAPEVKAVYDYNHETFSKQGRKWRKEHKSEFIPMRRLPSPHLWEGPGTLVGVGTNSASKAPSTIKIRYTDPAMRINVTEKIVN